MYCTSCWKYLWKWGIDTVNMEHVSGDSTDEKKRVYIREMLTFAIYDLTLGMLL